MKPWLRFLIIFVGTLYVGCSKVEFETKPSAACENFNSSFGEGTCVLENGLQKFNYSVKVGEVDILFVTDNSGSMYAEQVEMANRFPGFLDSLFDIDYQIAIITTDVSVSPSNPADAENGNGAFQDGKFLQFPNGSYILSNPSQEVALHDQNIYDFANTVKRSESANCDASNFSKCPSGDERGIYALNMALDRAENSSFFREAGHLAVVILSDEDERSTGGEGSVGQAYPLEDYDLPETFVDKTATQLGPTKTVSVHSIIIKPGDAACKNQQDAQGNVYVTGEYGDIYKQLSKPTLELQGRGNLMEGVLGSICSNNYTNELGNIKDKISENISDVQLPCSPYEDSLEVTLTPDLGGVTYDVDANNRVVFTPAVPAGTTVNLQFECQRF